MSDHYFKLYISMTYVVASFAMLKIQVVRLSVAAELYNLFFI